MGIDLMNVLQITFDHGRKIWSLPCGDQFPFIDHSHRHTSTSTFNTLCAVNGIITPNDKQKTQINKLLDTLLPPPDTPFTAANITPHIIDIQGHRPIKQKFRRVAPKLLKKSHAEVDKLLAQDII